MSREILQVATILWLALTIAGLVVSFLSMRELLRYYVITYKRRSTNVARMRYFYFEFWAEFVRVVVKVVFLIIGLASFFHAPYAQPLVVVGLLFSNLSLLINSVLQQKGRHVLRVFVRQVQNHERMKYPQGGPDGPES